MQKVGRLLYFWLWPIAIATCALIGLLEVRGHRQLTCLSAEVHRTSPDIGYMMHSSEMMAYLLFGLVWGALIQQMLMFTSGSSAAPIKMSNFILWGWISLTTLSACFFALVGCTASFTLP